MKNLLKLAIVFALAILVFNSCSNKQGTYSFTYVDSSTIVDNSRHQTILNHIKTQPYFTQQHTYTGGRQDVGLTASKEFCDACSAVPTATIYSNLLIGETFKLILTYADNGETVVSYTWSLGAE